jgi:ribosome maturation factor RimP
MDVRESVIKVIEPVLTSYGVELVDIEYQRERSGWVLRIYLDKEGGITLDDCSQISKEVGELIEVNDLIDHYYTLEVSSPGLNRPLKREKDFIRSIGKLIRVRTKETIEGQKNFMGELLSYRDDAIVLGIEGKEKVIPFHLVLKANLEYQFPQGEKIANRLPKKGESAKILSWRK